MTQMAFPASLTPDRPLLLLGCGNMGLAMLKGWLGRGAAPASLRVVEPAGPAGMAGLGLAESQWSSVVDQALRPRVAVLAVKPQVMADAVAPLRAILGPDTLVISIAAGIDIRTLGSLLGGHALVVRAMPNTPAAIGMGATVAVADPRVDADDLALATALLEAVGQVHVIQDERRLDGVTALSGSGPAYVCYLVECLTAAGVSEGLPESLAADLALETLLGTASLMKATGRPPAELRVQVTSPGGTTQAGLDVLMGENGLAPLIRRTLSAAAHRSRELGQAARDKDEPERRQG